MKTPTMQEALNQVSTIVQEVKATKSEHIYLEQCVLALTEAVRVYEIAHNKASSSDSVTFDEVKAKRKKTAAVLSEVKHDA